MQWQYVFYWSDILVYLLVAGLLLFIVLAARHEHWRASWRHVVRSKMGVVTLIIMAIFACIALLDSIHFTVRSTTASSANYQMVGTQSLLDFLVTPLGNRYENKL